MSKGRSLIQYSLCTWVRTDLSSMKHNNQAHPLYNHQHTYMYCMYTKISHMYILHTKSIPKHTATSTHSLHTNLMLYIYIYYIYNVSYNKHVCVCVCVCACVRACVRNGRSPEVIRPPGKCHFFLWGMATVGQREGVQ